MKSAQNNTAPSMFKTRIRSQLRASKQSTKNAAFLNISGVLLIVFSIIISSTWFFKENTDTVSLILAFTGALSIAAGVISGIYFAVKSFSYLLDKSESDMMLSLPVDSKTRFKADYAAGLLMCLISSAPILIPLLILSFFTPAFWAVIISMLMIYSCASLAAICSHSKTSAVLNMLLINISVPFVMLSLCALITRNNNGMELNREALNYLPLFSPAGCIEILYYVISYSRLLVAAVLINTAASAGITLISYRIYLKRTPEKTSRPFSYPYLYYFCIFSLIFSTAGILTITNSLTNALITAAALSFVTAFICFKSNKALFQRTVISCITAIAAAAVITVSSEKTDAFGMKNITPSADSVTYAEINAYDEVFYNHPYRMHPYYQNDKKIQKMIDFQKELIDSGTDSENNTDNSSYISFEYRLKNNITIYRKYYVPSAANIHSDLLDN